MSGDFKEGFSAIELSEEALANMARAAYYETMAKTGLSLCLKALRGLNHDQWVKIDQKDFGSIVTKIETELEKWPNIAPYFEKIKHNHKKWRDQRNFVIHSNWGKNEAGKAVAYCYRSKQLGDENDIVRAVNDCFWLAKEMRTFQYQIALLIASGSLPEGDDGAGVAMATPSKTVRF
jgi:hypothetical protein